MSSHTSKKQYKPTALRWPYLLSLLLALLAILASLSYAVALLPVVESRDRVKARAMYQPVSSAYSPTKRQSAFVTKAVVHGSLHRDGLRENINTNTSTSIPTHSSVDPGDHGHIGTVTVTVAEPSTSPTEDTPGNPDDGHPEAATTTVFEPITNTPTETASGDVNDNSDSANSSFSRSPSDYASIGAVTITGSLPDSMTPSDPMATASETTAKPKSDSKTGEPGSETVGELPESSTVQVDGTVVYTIVSMTVVTNEEGSPITTLLDSPRPSVGLLTSTLTNAEGKITGTEVMTVTITPSIIVETNSHGDPTATITVGIYPISPSIHTEVYSIDGGQYFIGVFLPTVVASILAIAVRILDTNVKYFQPWHALTHEQGAAGRDSLCLATSGYKSLVMGLRSLAGGQAVVFLSSFLWLASSLLIPFAAGSILLDLRGEGCKIGGSSASNCAYVLSVSPSISKATIGILAVMSFATVFLVVIVGRWCLGVYTNPWSMCTLASLSTNPEVQRLVLAVVTGPNVQQARSQLKHHDFKLDYFRGTNNYQEYGIIPFDRLKNNYAKLSSTHEYERVPLTSTFGDNEAPEGNRGSPFMLSIIGRLCLLLVLIGVLILVLYYYLTGGDTAFERFIDSDSFGVKFLFTSLGVIISLFWSAFLVAVATMTPYQVLTERHRVASQSILLSPITNAFSGLWRAARTRRIFLGFVSVASILSETLGIFLGNIRFQVTQTFFVFQLCTWTAVGIMSLMVLILLASFFVKWPNMPVDPNTIAGAMYYVCNTSVLDRFEGLSLLDKEQRDRTVTDMALLYDFGGLISDPGERRIGLRTLNTNGVKA